MHAVHYHHGCRQSRKLLARNNREWVSGLKLPAAAREQLAIAMEMIDAIDIQLVSGILQRIGMGKLGRLGLEPAVRYQRERPGS